MSRLALLLTLLILLTLFSLCGCETLVGARKDLHHVGNALQGAAHGFEAGLNQ
jgi:predicted small secreted protein